MKLFLLPLILQMVQVVSWLMVGPDVMKKMMDMAGQMDEIGKEVKKQGFPNL